MNNRHTQPGSIDGFSLRRRTPQAGTSRPLASDNMRVPERFLHDGNLPRPVPSVSQRPQLSPEARPLEPNRTANPSATGLRRSEIDESLKSIDSTPKAALHKRRWRPGKRFFKRLVLAIVLIIVLVVGYIGIKAIIASGKVFNGSIFDLLGSGQQLKTDQYGRSNILIFGTSEDDPGHDGANLTDSLMVVSIDQKNKNAVMVSVPRDLWVKYGQSCDAGNEGKINALYQCYSNDGADEADGADALKQKAGDVLGLDIQYYAHVNYTVVKQVVDAVGGVQINIQSSDPRGILDRNFDWKCNYKCYYVKYPNGETPVLDGEHALYLARARGDDNGQATYGLGGGNFDREKNQQKILTAVKAKAMTAGTLSNPIAVTNLIDALGNNVRTNFNGGEIKTLINLGKDIPDNGIRSINLIDPGDPVVTTGNYEGQSIVRPVAGVYDFSEIQSFIRSKLNASNGEEAAEIEVLNGSSRIGAASAESKTLKSDGVDVTSLGDTDDNNYPAVSWYDLSGGKLPKTAAKLQQALGQSSSGTTLPTGVQSSADFVIIVGDGTN